MKPYKKYKNSGVEWIGDIPCDWELPKLKYFVEIKDGTHDTPDYVENTSESFPLITTKDIKNNEIIFDNAKHISKFDFLKINKRSNVELYNVLMPMIGTVGNPCVVLTKKLFSIKNVALFKTENITKANFIKFYLESNFVKYQFDLLNRGGVQKFVSLDILQNLYILIPNDIEKIVDYLDKKTKVIDNLITDKENLVTLLKEQRQAIISETVTKGLDTNVPLKDSGVEWIGDIPCDWELPKLKLLTLKIGSGKTPKGGSEVYLKKGIVFLRSQNIYNTGLLIDEVAYICEEIDNDLSNSRLILNDVLLNITGGSIGRCCIWDKDIKGNVNQHVCIIRTNERVLPYFIHYLFISKIGERFIQQAQTGANREGLNFENIGNFPIPYPPIEEQQKIVDYLDEKTSKIDSLIEDTTKQITLLKEYRQSLISEVVTGKFEI